MLRCCAIALLCFTVAACSRNLSGKIPSSAARRIAMAYDTSRVFSQSFTGFHLQDAETGEVILSRNSDHYFTPASNTKILTLATCLAVLGDSIPTLRYWDKNGGLYIMGTGDPTFLHERFEAWQPARHYLKNHPTEGPILYTSERVFFKKYGDGWAWDDAQYDYQAERNGFPLYGNCFWVELNPEKFQYEAQPAYFNRLYNTGLFENGRAENSNEWAISYYKPGEKRYIPFRTSPQLVTDLLQDTLHRPVALGAPIDITERLREEPDWKTLYACPVDTVYKWMMYESDNLFAEQLLIMAAERKIGIMKPDSMIKVAIRDIFPKSEQPPRWVDGSGLSRYNLVTPRYLSQVLQQLYRQHDKTRLFNLFPAGGARGTIQNWYGATDQKPFVFAKTGSMSGVHCLSGYIVTDSGKTLIFSFMHNNFVGSNRPWKSEMQRLLNEIKEWP